MQVILTEDVANLGEMGEVVTVSPGYGRNFLIPKGLALPASATNARQLQHHMEQIEVRKERQREEARAMLGEIDNISVTIPMRAGDNDKLFGSVTNRQIADVLAQQGHNIERRRIELARPISELGIYTVPIKLASGIYAHVRVWVVQM